MKVNRLEKVPKNRNFLFRSCFPPPPLPTSCLPLCFFITFVIGIGTIFWESKSWKNERKNLNNLNQRKGPNKNEQKISFPDDNEKLRFSKPIIKKKKNENNLTGKIDRKSSVGEERLESQDIKYISFFSIFAKRGWEKIWKMWWTRPLKKCRLMT